MYFLYFYQKFEFFLLRFFRILCFKKEGKNCHICFGNFCDSKNISFGKNVYVGEYANFYGRGGIDIGDNTIIAMRCTIHSSNHRFDAPDLKSLPYDDVTIEKPVSIGKNVWIGDLVSIAPGAVIGDGAVVALGSHVSGKIPPLAIVGGNPAQVLKYRDEAVYNKLWNEEKFYLQEKYGKQ